MRKSKRKLVLLSILVLLLAAFLTILALFWPVIRSAVSVERLEDGLYVMEYSGDYGLDSFLEQGGASSDLAVADFVMDRAFHGIVDLNLQGSAFGCSTLAVTSPEGNALFGRNFDWGNCAALIVQTRPKDGYASISTVNMVHFAIADAQGNRVVAEDIDNELVVTETPVVTNFYLTPGEKYGVGTAESQTRHAMLTEQIAQRDSAMDMDDVRDALDSVNKHNFDSPFASTEWSIVYDQTARTADYYHRENYERVFSFDLR